MQHKEKKKGLIKAGFSLLFWLGLWFATSFLVNNDLLLPGPGAVLARLGQLSITSAFWRSVAASLLRILGGTLAGILFGLVLGTFSCAFPPADIILAPALRIIRATPVASFVILVLLWVGRDILPAVITALIVIPVVWENVCAGIRGTDPQLLEMAEVFAFSRIKKLCTIYIPSAAPVFAAACRSAGGLAWKAGVAAEVLTVPVLSIGRNLYDAKLYLETTDLFAWTLVIILCSVIIEKVLEAMLRFASGKYSSGKERDDHDQDQ